VIPFLVFPWSLAHLIWARDFGAQMVKREISAPELSEAERKAVLALADLLSAERPGEEVQNAILEVARARGIKPPGILQAVIHDPPGHAEGPRLGPYIARAGCRRVAEALRRAVGA